ncbi:flagellin FliC [Shigella boydii]|uniref:flagellin FliC n=1 Tax=Shigella boydii TaxID=621 RepID=UPI001077BD53|nr:flagellin FliC [Shigella boydii]EAA4813574.1 flagellin FliC [Shigella boydii]EFV7689731.1 FliC/FljB family flagellin [Shigella boydii]EFX6080236.1 FliC/FljB family flagellin [Shigella boydii]EFY9928386.1 FliC/FljB family flagellin [Shigella boydii]EFZ3801968.1 FliC/FljB family flagellin [Shigella boydii]
MVQVINTNSLSLITQNNINKNQSALSSSIERLSSGLRINSAKDDAAGQAIANRFTSNIKGLTQAARNANDGISVAQTTEGALSEINNNLQRIRELTVQASTGTNSDSVLDSIQDEIKSRLDEIDRVSGQTQFNGVNVLAKDGSMKIQVGANDGQTITIDLKKIDSDTLGLSGFNVNGGGAVANTAASKADLVAANATVVGNKYTVSAGYDAAKASDLLAGVSDGDTVQATINNGFGTAASATNYKYDSASKSYSFDTTTASAADVQKYLTPGVGDTAKGTITIDGSAQDVQISSDGKITSSNGDKLYIDTTGRLTKNGSSASLTEASLSTLAANNTKATTIDIGGTSISFTGNSTTPNTITYSVTGAKVDQAAFDKAVSTSGNNVDFTTAGYSVDGATGAVTKGVAPVYVDNNGALTTSDTVDFYLQDDGSVTNGSGKAVYKDADGKLTTDAETKAATTADPLKALDEAISSIDKFRSSLGAVQNRLDSAVTNLNNTTTNLSEAQSRIQDADYATEVSNMSKAQIIQQAGNSVLAKANQVPQQVLSLLQG